VGPMLEMRDKERGAVKMDSLVTGCVTNAAAMGSYTSSAGHGLHAYPSC
jgi:hypothetical protein